MLYIYTYVSYSTFTNLVFSLILRISYNAFWSHSPLPTLPKSGPHPHPFNFVCIFFLNSQEQFVPLKYSWMCGLLLELGQVTSSYTLRENWLHFPAASNCQYLPIDAWDLCSAPLGFVLAWACKGLVHVVTTTHFICKVTLLCPENTISL